MHAAHTTASARAMPSTPSFRKRWIRCACAPCAVIPIRPAITSSRGSSNACRKNSPSRDESPSPHNSCRHSWSDSKSGTLRRPPDANPLCAEAGEPATSSARIEPSDVRAQERSRARRIRSNLRVAPRNAMPRRRRPIEARYSPPPRWILAGSERCAATKSLLLGLVMRLRTKCRTARREGFAFAPASRRSKVGSEYGGGRRCCQDRCCVLSAIGSRVWPKPRTLITISSMFRCALPALGSAACVFQQCEQPLVPA